ncbi:hypothetical protein BKA63DRAFT_561007 [Paraphoma chrysanthemicola]|nr:hypothetical protein BKA63DRAFT_561007 [Paraphoma chrysanthemicola]
MGSMYPSRTKITGMRGVAIKVEKSATHTAGAKAATGNDLITSKGPANSAILSLELPEELQKLLYMDGEYICIQYRDLLRYHTRLLNTIDLTGTTSTPCTRRLARPSSTDKPTIHIDITSHTPEKPTLPSLNILPYIYVYLTYRHVRFAFLSSNDTQGAGLTGIACNVVYKHADSWRRHVVESDDVVEVQIWWKETCMDIVLRPGSERAIAWDLHTESKDIFVLKQGLGLIPTMRDSWKGAVVVASVESSLSYRN